MTYSHHHAVLETKNEKSAVYKFTPDLIKSEFWGKVQFNFVDFSFTIVEYAKDPNCKSADYLPLKRG